MILKRIEFKNIRSYSDESIEFPLGRTLFEGDIGSGKSSILMAIEFALFGLGSETGGSLLKIGGKEGSVRLVFEVDGKEYEITRGLIKKGQRIQQTAGRVKTSEEVLDLSPTELKEKILDILKFNEEPDPKAQSRIYRYAVYTPQEEMKTILVMAPEDRLQILRRAFGIEDYRIAVNNSEALVREIKGRVRELRSAVEEVEGLRETLGEEKRDLEATRKRAASLSKEEGEVSGRLAGLKEDLSRLREDEVKLRSLSKEVESQERTAKSLRNELRESREDERLARERLSKAKSAAEEPDLREGMKSRTELEEEVRKLEDRSKRLAILEDRIDQKIDEYRSIVNEGVCPVCDRPVRAHEFVEKEKSKTVERAHVEEEVRECEVQLKHAMELLEERKEYDATMERVAFQKEAKEESRRRLARAEDSAARLAKELREVEDTLESAKRELLVLNGSSERLRLLEESVSGAEAELRRVGNDLARTKARVEEKVKALLEHEGRLQHAEEAAEKVHRLGERQIWLEDYFAPTVAAIEKQVMTSVNQEFDSDFKKWFSILIDDSGKEVRVDENFTPIVTQDGYEQESEYLSGGERTSVALAYRLALNTLVQHVSMGMKSNILILDEPTDGFSREQLGSVREILDEVGCPQIIIVSHEKELESFADQIFRVTKTHGESRIESAVSGLQ